VRSLTICLPESLKGRYILLNTPFGLKIGLKPLEQGYHLIPHLKVEAIERRIQNSAPHEYLFLISDTLA
jgi:hypothetical protein